MPAHVPPVPDERSALLGFLAQQRQAVRVSAYGLTDDQAAATPSASALSVGGIVKHLSAVERSWAGLLRGGRFPASAESYLDGFRVGATESLDGLLADYAAAARETDEVVTSLELDGPVPVPHDVPWMPRDVDEWSVRWVVLHLIEETARHAGHADVVRESLDGASAISLLAAAEGWPADGWIRPWQPATSAVGA